MNWNPLVISGGQNVSTVMRDTENDIPAEGSSASC